MKKEEIIKKAIEKAVKNGYSKYTKTYLDEVILGFEPFEVIIFSHDFAKAFWGEEVEDQTIKYQQDMETIDEHGNVKRSLGEIQFKTTPIRGWQHHLQQMVLEEDPVKYLEKFIK